MKKPTCVQFVSRQSATNINFQPTNKTGLTFMGLVCVIALTLGIGIMLNPKNTLTVYAAETMYNPALNVSETRIDGWREIQNMSTYGHNDDEGCGITAMALLLQFYDDYSRYAGEILPDHFDYKLDADINGDNARANALRGYDPAHIGTPIDYVDRNDTLFDITPKLFDELGAVGSWLENKFKSKNATVPDNHKNGLDKYFKTNCSNLNIAAYSEDILDIHDPGDHGEPDMRTKIKNHINNNRPVLLTILSYKNTYFDDDAKFGKDAAHVVLAYGYRTVNHRVEYLAHSGWGNSADGGTEVWFSPNGLETFEYGFTYINAPLDRFNTTTVSNGTGIRIDSLKRNATGELRIPTHLNGLPVTEIGNNAFTGQAGAGITSVIIPETVTSIGTSAFAGLANLTQVNLGTSPTLQTIGNSAFNGCIQLSQISIPASVTSIEDQAFAGCTGLTDLTIPNSVTSVGYSAFGNCKSLRSLSIGDLNQSDASIRYLFGQTFGPYQIPASLTTVNVTGSKVADGMFGSCSNVTDIILSDSVTKIGNSAFAGTNLNSFILPKNITSIGERAFASSSLASITFESGSQLENIGESAFVYTNLTNINLPKGVTSIGKSSFWGCSSLTSITLESGSKLETIGAYAFSKSKIGSINLPKSVTSIGQYAFSDNSSFTSITFESGSRLETIGDYAFTYTSLTSINLPKSVTSIGKYAFRNLKSLTTLTFESGSGLKTIGDHAFANSSISNVILPDGVTDIGDYAFYDCRNAFTALNLESVKNIGKFAFQLCNSLIDVRLGKSLTSVGGQAFDLCKNIESFVVDAGNSYYRSEGNCLIERNTKTLIFGTAATYIPEDITAIEDWAFLYNTKITNITIPASVKSIGGFAFGYCTSLKNVTFESGTDIGIIREYMFYECSALEKVSIPKSVKRIMWSSFLYCANLQEIHLEATAYIKTEGTILDIGAFDGCDSFQILVDRGSYEKYIALNPYYADYFNSLPNIFDSYFEGFGISSYPYQISSASQLYMLAEKVNEGYPSKGLCFELTNDIYLNNTTNWKSWSETNAPLNHWTPIGRPEERINDKVVPARDFRGIFNGNGYAVKGMYINSGSYQGLFGTIEGAVIKNLGVEESYVSGGTCGAIVGRMGYSTIINCYNKGKILGGSVGGIVGFVFEMALCRSIIADCYNGGEIYGSLYAGGIVGQMQYTAIVNCYNDGSIFGGQFVGGIVGYNSYVRSSLIVNNCNMGNVSGDSIVDGIAGRVIAKLIYNYDGGVVQGNQSSVLCLNETTYYNYYGSIEDLVEMLNEGISGIYQIIDPIVCGITNELIEIRYWQDIGLNYPVHSI